MVNLFKADFFRLPREKVGVIPLGILTFLIGMISFFAREYSDVSVVQLISPISLVIVLTIISSSLYFWGNDFQHRTVNNLISKKVSRKKVFTYKVLATMLLSLFYDAYALALLGICRQLFSGKNDWPVLLDMFGQSLLFYLVLVAFAILIFNLFKSNALAITGYVVYLLVFEQLVMLAAGFLLKLDFLAYVFWANNYQRSLQEVHPEMFVFGLASLIVFLTVSYVLFSRHELK